jgi:lipopolysaccharide export system permease protein
MNILATLSRYLARGYLLNVLIMLMILLGLIYLFDTVELLRRASKKGDVPLSLVLEMGLLKLPEVGQLVFPFAILFSAIYTFWQLTRRHELVVVRSAGFSVWQFLAPIMSVAVFLGVLQITVINPMSAMLLTRFERLEGDFLSQKKNLVTLSKEGLWLRQPVEGGYAIIHSKSVDTPDWTLQNAMILFFTENDKFSKRIDSPKARLDRGQWLFHNAVLNTPFTVSKSYPVFAVDTELTVEEIEDSFSSPETMSFWTLPAFIKTMESTGFDATRLKIHYHSLLSQPLLFAAMILLAASVSLRPPRSRATMNMIVMGVIIGFIVFFLSSFLQALGASHQIPVLLSAWTPSLVTFLLGTAVMLNLEDG